MIRPAVFLASSSESIEIMKEIRILLLQELDKKATLEPWSRAFELSATYIESLENAMMQADFAIILITADDKLIKRQEEKTSPRNNVLFELGLMMGEMGRERCFIIQESKLDLELPSDLLGVRTAKFTREDLKSSLDLNLARISQRIVELGPRCKIPTDRQAIRPGIFSFCSRIEGSWWERISFAKGSAISFLTIEHDQLFNSVSLSGRSYDKDGEFVAHWKSLLARVEPSDNKVQYLWTGAVTEAELAHVGFHGLGVMEFEVPSDQRRPIKSGRGRFWDVNEADPTKTVVKPVDLRRVADQGVISTMRDGTKSEIKALATALLQQW